MNQARKCGFNQMHCWLPRSYTLSVESASPLPNPNVMPNGGLHRELESQRPSQLARAVLVLPELLRVGVYNNSSVALDDWVYK